MVFFDTPSSYFEIEAERGFRSLEQELQLRPMYHRKEERIRAHILLCFLALVLIRVAENRAETTWNRIREEMNRMHLVELDRSGMGKIFLISEPTSDQRRYLKSLDIPVPSRTYAIRPG